MRKLFHKRYKTRFPEILRRAAKCMELSFGLELKEGKPNGYSYTLVSKIGLISDEVLNSSCEVPKNGLLMPLLNVIYLNGNRASVHLWMQSFPLYYLMLLLGGKQSGAALGSRRNGKRSQ